MNMVIFKSYSIRGIYPSEINEGTVGKIAEALGRSFRKGKIIIGCDARTSSPFLYKAALNSLPPKNTTAAGVITTPMLYFLVNHLKADLGIMISASHNPKEYNGLKIVEKGAAPMSREKLLQILQNHA